VKIFIATKNKKKINEINEILTGYEIVSINDGFDTPEVIEDGNTFEENSKKKAVEIAKYLNMVTIADDSGLCVEALDGAPGIYSSRFAGENATDEENNLKLVETLKGEENRNAKFVCVITLAKPTGEAWSFRGEVQGEITEDRGQLDGFGYDPYFYLKDYGKCFSDIPEVKKEISHRALALKAMEKEIKNIF